MGEVALGRLCPTCYDSLLPGVFFLLVNLVLDNAGVIVNNKGEMKGK